MNYEHYFKRLLIFDGSHALHRALSVPNNWEMKNSQGFRTGGVFGVLRTIQKELKTYNYYPVVVFDSGLSQRRLNLYPNYKHTQDKQLLQESLEPKTEEQLLQEEFLQEYKRQRNILSELLPYFNIPVIKVDNWEGDDLIYLLTKLCENSIVVSDDKDLLQLIREDETGKCRVRRAMRDEFWDINTLHENNFDINEYIACKAICGDTSDNIPSACFGVGEKTASGLYQLYEACKKSNLAFPKEEKDLTELCKKLNISKRKAYINFNENQFLTNLLLTDLSIVDEDIQKSDPEMLLKLKDYILDFSYSYNENDKTDDITIIKNYLQDLEIKTFDDLDLYDHIISLKDVINNISDLDEINIPKSGKSIFDLI